MNQKALIIGGDKRQEYLKNDLDDKFNEVFHLRYAADMWVLEEIESFSYIVLPVPVSKDGEHINSGDNLRFKLCDLLDYIQPCHKIFGSGFDCKTLDYLEDKQIDHCDFMKDKTFKRANAHLTAQGALRLILNGTEDYIVGKKALIIGFGDVADTLAEKLRCNGMDVYITARNKRKLGLATLNGYKTIALPSLSSCIYLFDYVIGTVPANLLTLSDISKMKDDSTYLELASAPYTAKAEDFKTASKNYINGSALPGRFLPLASGKLLADFILSNI